MSGIGGWGGCGPAVPAVAPLIEPGEDPGTGSGIGIGQGSAASGPGVVAPGPRGGTSARPGRRIVVGEMCPLGVAGRPGLAPLLLRGVQWTDEPVEVGNAISHGEATKFSVFGVDGKRAGVFDPVGIAEVGLPQLVAAGSYTGAGPCTRGGANGVRLEEPQCQGASKGCGIAVATLGDAAGREGAGSGQEWKTGGACVSGDELAIDVDGDGTAEAFPIAGLLDGLRAPAEVVEARPQVAQVAGGCTPSFTVFGLRSTPPVDAGAGKMAEKYVVLMDVLAVVDLDDDGRQEVVLGLRYPDSRSIVVYGGGVAGGDGGGGGAVSLRLIGEATSWAK